MRAIDLAINVDMSRLGRPSWLEQAGETFQRGESWYQDIELEELLPLMDEHGIEKAVLGIDVLEPSPHVMRFVEREPSRFYLAAGVDPRLGMRIVRGLDAFKREHPQQLVEARITPFLCDLAPNTPLYYPIYSRCIELDLPIGIYTGLPVPPMPGECQNPIHLDRVCLDFPELRIIMCHGADPWWDVAIRLMLKYPNLYLQTSAWAPKRLPARLFDFMNTRGRNKVMWASNHPSLPIERCFRELPELPLRKGVLDRYVYANAASVLFGSSR